MEGKYTFYKGKGAMRVSPISPQMEDVTTDAGAQFQNLKKAGALLVELAPAQGTRDYDWDNKAVIALNQLEMAAIAFTDPDEMSEDGLKFFHDPNKGQEAEGTVTKSCVIKPSNNGGILIGIRQKDNGETKQPFIILGPTEYSYFRELARAASLSTISW